MSSSVAQYSDFRQKFVVTREFAQQALDWAQPLALEALGIHTQRQILVDGELPTYVVMTTPETNGGWSELMPVWFKPYERPVPLYCLDNWALFALLYSSAFGLKAGDSSFTVENLVRVIVGADLLMPFLPATDGAGRFLRHGTLPILLAILWLDPEARADWLALHECGAHEFARANDLHRRADLSQWLEQIENEAWLVPEGQPVAGEAAVNAFLTDPTRLPQYQALFGGICLSVSALAAARGVDWRGWVFQAVNVGYRTPDFAMTEIAAWLSQPTQGV